jgi:NAD(P)-dependent dehydrogenase (short-subunit alcohol dehydrogenase family)
MAHIFITGSADGLGRAAAETLLGDGHDVIVHARSAERLANVNALIVRGASAAVGDLADLDQTRAVADQVNRLGPVNAVIHNAGVLSGSHLLPVNVVAPYLLTALVRAERLVYLSSDMHHGGRPDIAGLDWSGQRATSSYSDSKLLVTTLAVALARLWPHVYSNAVDPGWVPTRMGGPRSPRRPPAGTPDPRVACHQRRTRGPHQRRILVPQATPQSTPGGSRPAVPRRPSRRLGALHRRAADLSRRDCCIPCLPW